MMMIITVRRRRRSMLMMLTNIDNMLLVVVVVMMFECIYLILPFYLRFKCNLNRVYITLKYPNCHFQHLLKNKTRNKLMNVMVLQYKHYIRYCLSNTNICRRERKMFYLTTHSTHFIYGYMASDIWLRTILIVRKETRCRHRGYSYRLTARVLLYAPSHRQDNTYHGFCYTSRGALAGTRYSSMGPPHEGSIRRPTAPRANALHLSYVPLPYL